MHTLHIQRLYLAFEGAAAPLLDIRDWALPAGLHLLHVDGGAGKTSCLRLLAGRPAPAACAWERVLLAEPPHPRQAEPGFWHEAVFYEDVHAPHWTEAAQDQPTARAWLATLEAGTSPALQRAREQLLEEFGLVPHLDKQLFMLSTGTRQKLMLLAALLSPRPVVLLDEPLAGLDWHSIRAFWYALAVRQRIAGQRVVLATATPPQDLPPLRWTGVWSFPG